jgi:alkylation response protein AidB-like acyl-CoA dehydrogenase
MGLKEIDFVLIAQEFGRAALSEPVLDTAVIGAFLISESKSEELKEKWLPRIALGEAKLSIGHEINPCVADAHVADLILIQRNNAIYALTPDQLTLELQPSVDPTRKLFKAEFEPLQPIEIANGEIAQKLMLNALNRGALCSAAQQLGLAQQMVDMSVHYATERHQFGKPIGSFQAIKHHLATVQVQIEFATPVVYRAANSVSMQMGRTNLDVSHAKILASEATNLAAKTAIQVHGAIGYTAELDLHLWMKRAWALDITWGTRNWHKDRLSQVILNPEITLGSSETFVESYL